MNAKANANAKEIHPPTIIGTLEHLGNTDEARTYAMVQWAIEDAHRDLGKIYRGEV